VELPEGCELHSATLLLCSMQSVPVRSGSQTPDSFGQHLPLLLVHLVVRLRLLA
jgi:hypothetical protein